MKKFVVTMLIISSALFFKAPVFSKSRCTDLIPDIFEKVSPAVVSISAYSIDPYKLIDRVNSVYGSGFIINENGTVITNSHVVFGRKSILVVLDNGDMIPAELVGADPILDLAVLRIPVPQSGLPTIPSIGDSDSLRIGEEVIAIGSPFGLEQTLTVGVVSGINRILPISPMSLTLPLIQTDAAINPGNSGGPLLNRCGEVIGITTSILGNAQNIGFAIPIDLAGKIIPQLIKEGRVIRPWIGIHGQFITRDLEQVLNIPIVTGFLIETIEPFSPARKAGIQEGVLPISIGGMEYLLGGDIVTAINGKPVEDPESFARMLNSITIGQKITLTLFSEDKTRQVSLIPIERPVLPGDVPPGDERMLMPMRDSQKD